MEPEIDEDTVELLRWVFQTNKRYGLTHSEIKTLFLAFDEREKSRRAAVQMGVAMATYLKEREDMPGKIARLFLEMFRDELLPKAPSVLDRLLAEGPQTRSDVNQHETKE